MLIGALHVKLQQARLGTTVHLPGCSYVRATQSLELELKLAFKVSQNSVGKPACHVVVPLLRGALPNMRLTLLTQEERFSGEEGFAAPARAIHGLDPRSSVNGASKGSPGALEVLGI